MTQRIAPGVALPFAARRTRARLIAALLSALALPAAADVAADVVADTLTVATFNAELVREGPGLLLRDLLKGEDAQAEAAAAVIAAAAPDVLVLTGIDYDHGLAALSALAARIALRGVDYPHRLALRPNAGWMTPLDLDGDGRLGGAGDAQGWGRFAGEGGMAVLSRLPIDATAVQDFSGLLWADLPGALLPPGMAPEVAAVQRLSSTGHWAVPVVLPGGGRLTLLVWHATPPVFDGPEDRNGRRNHDEAAFWTALLDGRLPFAAPAAPFVLLGDANLDPADGEGRAEAIRALLADPRLQDPAPRSEGGAQAAGQGAVNAGHRGDPALDTADWPDGPGKPGNMRVDLVLPSRALRVLEAGVLWPPAGAPLAEEAQAASRHRLVWVRLDLP